MKRNYRFIAILAALAVCTAVFCGCNQNSENGENSKNSSESSSAVSTDSEESSESTDTEESSEDTDEESTEESETPSDEESSESTEESDTSSDESGIDNEQNSKNASDAQSPSESSASTGNADFDEAFKDNALDAALTEEMKAAETTDAMVETLEKYEELWIAEAENANNKLQASSLSDEEKAEIQSNYDEWTNGFEAKRKEIVAEEKSKWTDGSIYVVNAAEKIKDYCREYAMNLYEKLYALDGSFELAYVGE